MLDASILKTPAVIIDNGSGSCKAGISGDSQPQSVISSEEYCIGKEALGRKGTVPNYPVERGVISCWDEMERLWNHIYEHELQVNSRTRPLLLSEPPLNPLLNRERITELMFERFTVPALYLSIQATLALYASARTTGLVMDSGHGVTHTVPVYDGYCLPHGVLRLDVAGKDITEYLFGLLGNGHFTSSPRRANRAIVKSIKENHCYVAWDPKDEAGKKAEEVPKLPDGTTVRINLCKAPEILFVPKTVGVERPGIHVMIIKSIRKCDKDFSGSLYGNVVLSGGSSLFQGLDGRIFKEIEQHVPKDVPIRIIAPPDRSYAAWLGASIITHLDSFKQMWFTREDYQEFGVAGIHRKCF